MKKIQLFMAISTLFLSGALFAQTPQRPQPAFDFTRSGSVLTVKSPTGNTVATIDLEKPSVAGKVVAFTYSAKKKKTLPSPETNAISAMIFPNPASGQVNLQLKGKWQLPAEVQIFSKLGMLVKTVALDDTNSSIDISSLLQGAYILKIVGKNASAIETLIVQ